MSNAVRSWNECQSRPWSDSAISSKRISFATWDVSGSSESLSIVQDSFTVDKTNNLIFLRKSFHPFRGFEVKQKSLKTPFSSEYLIKTAIVIHSASVCMENLPKTKENK